MHIESLFLPPFAWGINQEASPVLASSLPYTATRSLRLQCIPRYIFPSPLLCRYPLSAVTEDAGQHAWLPRSTRPAGLCPRLGNGLDQAAMEWHLAKRRDVYLVHLRDHHHLPHHLDLGAHDLHDVDHFNSHHHFVQGKMHLHSSSTSLLHLRASSSSFLYLRSSSSFYDLRSSTASSYHLRSTTTTSYHLRSSSATLLQAASGVS